MSLGSLLPARRLVSDDAALAHLLFDFLAFSRMLDEDGGRQELSFEEEADLLLRPRTSRRSKRPASPPAAAMPAVLAPARPGVQPSEAPAQIEHITCLVADDHPIVSEAVSRTLEKHEVEVVARALDGEEAVKEIEARRPVVALVDLRLPKLDGIEVARRAAEVSPETKVILYTGADPLLLSSALESGASGFLLKEAPVADLARAVRMVADGQIYFDPALAAFLGGSPATRHLNREELEILRLLAEGLTNEAISKQLCLSPETVRTHLRRLMTKLNTHSRTQAVATAIRNRLIA